jgi:hypothetical protein
MVGIGDDVNSKLLYYQNMNAPRRLGEMVMYGVAEQIRALLPFSLNQVVIKDRSNALSKSVVEDRIIQPLLATNTNVNPELISNHTLIKVCKTFFARIKGGFWVSRLFNIIILMTLILSYDSRLQGYFIGSA